MRQGRTLHRQHGTVLVAQLSTWTASAGSVATMGKVSVLGARQCEVDGAWSRRLSVVVADETAEDLVPYDTRIGAAQYESVRGLRPQ